MAPVTKRLASGALATTKVNLFADVRAVLDGRKCAAFVGAITERLFFALATGTPPIVFALFDLDCKGCVGSANGIGHGGAPYVDY